MTTILLRLLEHDLHRSNKGVNATPLLIETPAKPNFVPAVVSTITPGRFLVSRSLTKEGRVRSAVFKYDPDRADDLIQPLIRSAYDLSVSEDYKNRFTTASAAFNYIAETAGTGVHPSTLLIPKDWDHDRVRKFLGDGLKEETRVKQVDEDGFNEEIVERVPLLLYRNFCRVQHVDIDFPAFFSRPDYVGMYTQFLGGSASIFLHNVSQGLAFVVPRAKNVRR